ncbi:hypothetical protein [Paenarthrobacter ureafaciens]|uniref:hypothetical protein n=1 Tax=Paenarthrobacter ureafaciens TaxID=37931 RepID=UPI00140C5A51|nr:hypothetical protein [Paenarthrobacter ureafaciens]MCX8455137.1 hypothetical protein [Paenarthrobacter ureafaciens]MCY0974551.1 hypothetical protein [Paenarthrobacter ureafaciens]
MESASRINWKTISENDFNETVEALIVRDRTGNGLVAQAIDGRGGDGGIDIDVKVARTGQLTEILQLKWFPDGFSGARVKRRDQIRDSFKAAMAHRPAVWTLVVPANLTIPERKAVYALKKDHKVHIRLIGAAELNNLLALYPKLHDWALRDTARDLLSLVGREKATLSQPGDLSAEVENLADRSDAISPYWGFNFSSRDGVTTSELYAKREDAMEREPLSFSLETQFGPEDEELRQEFENSLDYGVTKQLILPSRVISSFTKEGPEWFAGEEGPGELQILPADEGSRDIRIDVTSFDVEGKRLGSVSARKGRFVAGNVGGTLEFSTPGGLSLAWRLPKDAGAGSVRVDFAPEGHGALDVRKALGFASTLHEAANFLIAIDGQVSELNLAESSSEPVGVPAVSELIEDLAIIEVKTGVTFAFPKFLPPALDRIWARIIRRILEGGYIALPNTDGFNVTLSGATDETIEKALVDGGAMLISHEDWAIELLDETVFLGNIAIYFGHVSAENGAEHVEALKAGNGTGRRVSFRSASAIPGVIYIPGHPDAKESVVAEPWGLTGIREHANVR